MKKVEVLITKTYYKATTMMVEVPKDIKDDDIHDYLLKLEDDTCILSNELANASLNGDLDGVEVELV